MSARRTGTIGLMVLLLACTAAVAQVPPEGIPQKQEIQKRVRNMARELVAGILDIQLRQLEENGLASLELYGDIQVMRRHIDELIDAEMPEVVELLAELQTGPADRREQTFVLARQKSREILVRLLVERQALLRRLRVAEMVAQVKRLIELETGVLETTESLPEQVQSQRESITLATIEDQRDVKALYLGLKEMLRDASTWGGLVGAEAATGLRRLHTARVDQEIDNARVHLEETQFSDAADSLRKVIEGLRTLLESIERAQGLVSGDVQSARDTIRQLAERQEQVRQATSQPDLSQPAMDELAQEQSEIRNELAELREELQPSSAAERPLAEAEQSAYEAIADLFEGQPEEAMADQQAVLDNLDRATQAVERAGEPQLANLTAEQYDQLIEDLEGAREDLQKIREEQETASELAREKPAEARTQEKQVADMLAEVPKDRQLPQQVDARLDEAEEAATDAAAQMGGPEEQRLEATTEAEQAIERAAAEVERALADALRHREGVEIAELARAARALDQAAAAERQIAREAQQAADAQGMETDQAEALGQRQADVQDVAERVAQGVQQTAPEAAKILGEASGPLEAAGKQLQAAAQQPGEPSKPAAQEASKQAEQAAEKLAQAADEIRRQIGASAEELAALTGGQLDQTVDTRRTVENAMENRPESMAERLQRLAEAEAKVQQAAAEQQRAAGRPEAAQAMELADGIREALELQDRADQAAERLARRPDASPLNAIARQQEVAQAADRLGRQVEGEPAASEEQAGNEDPGAEQRADEAVGAEPEEPQGQDEAGASEQAEDLPSEGPEGDSPQPPEALAEALQRAEEAAGEAARDLLDTKPNEARAARAETREALEEALELATAEAERAAEAPAGEPDPAAQEQVGQAVAEAQELARPDAPQAADTLAEAGQTSEQAEQQARQGEPETAAEAQQATADLLEQAESQIAEAMDQLAQQAGEQMAGQSQQAGGLTDQAIPVDPGATADLQSAENQAAEGAGEVPQVPEQAAPAEQGIAEAMDEAVADLLAREQELARDQALAQALAELAAQQQEAADELSQAEAAAPEMGEAIPPSPLSAALAEAWGQLTQLQQATVQAAQEVAGQRGMANEPIQEAAALAAAMAQAQESSQVSSPLAAGGGAAQQGQFVENLPPQPAPLQQAAEPPEGIPGTPDAPDQEAETEERRFLEEPWVMQLPPELRAAIRAGSQRRPPRGYEERLKRYFKNID